MSTNIERNGETTVITSTARTYERAAIEALSAAKSMRGIEQIMIRVSVRAKNGQYYWFMSSVIKGSSLYRRDMLERIMGRVETARGYRHKSILSRNDTFRGPGVQIFVWEREVSNDPKGI